MQLFGTTKCKIKKDKNDDNIPYLEINEVALIHCNVVNKSYQQNSRALYTFPPNKSFRQLLDFSPETYVFSKTLDLECLFFEIWFTDLNSKPLLTEDKLNINLVVN